MADTSRRPRQLSRRAILQVGAGTGLAVAAGTLGARAQSARAGGPTFRWDIVSLHPEGGVPVLSSGGEASARTVSGERITVTGSGTFIPDVPTAVTGGGTAIVRSPAGAVLFNLTFQVTRLLFWQLAPGSLPSAPAGPVNRIGDSATAHSGLVILAIDLSDGNQGTLTVSCHLPVGSPDQIFEGIVANHRFAFFFNSEAPQDNVDANRTAFHAL